ncbi:macro domain-containing protein [Coriobacteriia bacterium Es71-Z0120]|uniref:type II toxin-antitoxin system antitoxin DNA ADP-ribosyl glycohydrolase DarG n=1 Tax=Parvivirga hydrogeniphila TaxID=2939460 RepID=UPI0022609400|nr:macro domain-containing protein [Parvivirga hydrogeniphila]MCL4079461.1 macro domain-containing protein [Parvivirga hydrogeniphila]
MITYTTGNLFEAQADALVNTVNEVGVMGKGVALQFKESFPGAACSYIDAAKRGDVKVGRVFVTESHSLSGPRWIIHFPTKRHWRHPSKLEWVREGLDDLRRVIVELGISSIALPPLGCGNGGLDWADVRPVIESALGDLEGVEVVVYEPSARYATAPKQHGVEQLTPARALVAEMVRRYSVLGMGCTNLEVQKLAWFLQRAFTALGTKDPLRLRFAANKYGPYSDQLRHLLDAIDGSYLHSEKRLSEAGPFEPLHFVDEKRELVKRYLEDEAQEYLPALEATTHYIDGFESPLGMELLATVDWLVTQQHCEARADAIRSALGSWPGGRSAGTRKQQMFDDAMIEAALERVQEGIQTGQPQLPLF